MRPTSTWYISKYTSLSNVLTKFIENDIYYEIISMENTKLVMKVYKDELNKIALLIMNDFEISKYY